MASWDDVRRMLMDLPQVVEDSAGATTAWRVGSKAVAWERLLRGHELDRFGDEAPGGPALGLRVPHLGARAALLAEHPGAFFLVPQYLAHPMVLVHVERAGVDVLDEALTEAWLCRAPQRLVRAFLQEAFGQVDPGVSPGAPG